MKLELRTYQKRAADGWLIRRSVVLINEKAGTVIYVADTKDEPNIMFQTTIKRFKRWLSPSSPFEVPSRFCKK